MRYDSDEFIIGGDSSDETSRRPRRSSTDREPNREPRGERPRRERPESTGTVSRQQREPKPEPRPERKPQTPITGDMDFDAIAERLNRARQSAAERELKERRMAEESHAKLISRKPASIEYEEEDEVTIGGTPAERSRSEKRSRNDRSEEKYVADKDEVVIGGGDEDYSDDYDADDEYADEYDDRYEDYDDDDFVPDEDYEEDYTVESNEIIIGGEPNAKSARSIKRPHAEPTDEYFGDEDDYDDYDDADDDYDDEYDRYEDDYYDEDDSVTDEDERYTVGDDEIVIGGTEPSSAVESVADEVEEAAEDAAESVADEVEEATEDAVESVADEVEEATEDAVESVADEVEEAAEDAVESVADEVEEAAEDAVESVADEGEEAAESVAEAVAKIAEAAADAELADEIGEVIDTAEAAGEIAEPTEVPQGGSKKKKKRRRNKGKNGGQPQAEPQPIDEAITEAATEAADVAIDTIEQPIEEAPITAEPMVESIVGEVIQQSAEAADEEISSIEIEEAVVEPTDDETSEEVIESIEEFFGETIIEETEPVEEFAEEPVEEFADEPVEEFAEEPVEKFVEESGEEFVEEPVEEFAEEPAEKFVEESGEEFVEESVEELAEEIAEKLDENLSEEFEEDYIDGDWDGLTPVIRPRDIEAARMAREERELLRAEGEDGVSTDFKKKFLVSASPHIHCGETTRIIMSDVIIALVPAFLASVLWFGWRSAMLTAVCVVSCVLTEYVCRRVMKRKQTIGDLSAAVTGVILALSLPPSLNPLFAVIGSVVAIAVVKQMFGGLGMNFANPAVTARIVLMLSFPVAMTTWSNPFFYMNKNMDAVTSATPLSGGADSVDLFELFVGYNTGSLGETCVAALLLGGLYLLLRGVITWEIPVSYIGTVMLFSLVTGNDPLFQVMTGGLVFGAFFMATDYVTSPINRRGKLIFGVGCGIITMLIRLYGSMPEGVSFAILIMNILTPHIDTLTLPRPFGEERDAA